MNLKLKKLRNLILKKVFTIKYPSYVYELQKKYKIDKNLIDLLNEINYENSSYLHKRLLKILKEENVNIKFKEFDKDIRRAELFSEIGKTIIDNKIFFNLYSFSQEGEDLIIKELVKNTSKIYVDIGAHHPFRFSNTLYLYRKGWTGINIDPTPGTKDLFEKYRPKDINLEIAVSNSKDLQLNLNIFRDSALNTLDEDRAQDLIKNGEKLISRKKVEVRTLENILDKFLDNNKIGVLNIDVEKNEIDVLKSNNWVKYTPEIILIEITSTDLENIKDDKVHNFLKNLNYKIVAKTLRTAIYKHEESK